MVGISDFLNDKTASLVSQELDWILVSHELEFYPWLYLWKIYSRITHDWICEYFRGHLKSLTQNVPTDMAKPATNYVVGKHTHELKILWVQN